MKSNNPGYEMSKKQIDLKLQRIKEVTVPVSNRLKIIRGSLELRTLLFCCSEGCTRPATEYEHKTIRGGGNETGEACYTCTECGIQLVPLHYYTGVITKQGGLLSK